MVQRRALTQCDVPQDAFREDVARLLLLLLLLELSTRLDDLRIKIGISLRNRVAIPPAVEIRTFQAVSSEQRTSRAKECTDLDTKTGL